MSTIPDTTSFAAYHGSGWTERPGSMQQDIIDGTLWAPYRVNAEWGALRDVVLYIPSATMHAPDDSNRVLHLAPIDYARLSRQLTGLAACYERLGIRVHRLTTVPRATNGVVSDECHNLMFARDLFWMMPEGAMTARMASLVRAGEERHISATLASLGVPIVRTVSGTGTFEGADALWMREDVVLIGVGRRTNEEGARQLQTILAPLGVTCIPVHVPSCIQHLLGLIQIVDRDLVVVRKRHMTSELQQLLHALSVVAVELDETYEVTHRQAMNIICVGPRQVVMAANNRATRAIYEDHGLEVVAEVEIDELLKGAGGIGCATGILCRDRPP